MKSGATLILGCTLFFLALPPSLAEVPLASPEQDQHAKQALPPSGKALIYVYRLNDGNPKTISGIWLNNRDSGRLEPRTYGMWAASPGRLEVRAGRADSAPLAFKCEAGRVYFVQLAVNEAGDTSLKQMPYGTGRTEMGQARLVLDPAVAARAAAPAPAPSKQETPVKRETPQEADAYGVTLTLKVGSFQSLSKNQAVASDSLQVSTSSFVYGLEGEWRHENGFAVGLEWLGHSQDYTSAPAQSGDVALSYIFVNVKKYFKTDNLITGTVVQPYVGIGIGRSMAKYSAGSSGGVIDSIDSNAAQAMAGVVFRWQYVDLYTEYKYLHDKYSYGGEANYSGNGLFAGISAHF